MWDFIGDLLIGAAEGVSNLGNRRTPAPPVKRPSWVLFPLAGVCALGAAGAIVGAFFIPGGVWQVLKLVVLAIVLGACCILLVFAYYDGRAQWRRQGGLCVRCGYDLRANESGRCPECGAKAAAKRPAPPV